MRNVLGVTILAVVLLGEGQAAAETPLKLDYGSELTPVPVAPQPILLALNDTLAMPEAPLRLEYEILVRIERMSDTVIQIQRIVAAIPGPDDASILSRQLPSVLPPLKHYRSAVEETLARIARVEILIEDITRIIRSLPTAPAREQEQLPRTPDNIASVIRPQVQEKWLGSPGTLGIVAALACLALTLLFWWRRRTAEIIRSASKAAAAQPQDQFTPMAPTDMTTPLRETSAPAPNTGIPRGTHQPEQASPTGTDKVETAAQVTSVIHAHHAELDIPLEFDAPTTAPGQAKTLPPVPDGSSEDPAKLAQALELAEIMVSMGLTEGAARTLVEQIQLNPKRALPHWLKLLEIYHQSGMKEQFNQSAKELRTRFNVHVGEWKKPGQAPQEATLEDYPRILAQLQANWRKPECLEYLTTLLEDNRGGTRAGFPAAVAEEILLLISLLQ